jgi:hypothetical protein
VSLRRLRYQLRCAAKGHDTRPHLVGGSLVEQRCLRCGALVGEPEPAASGATAPAPPDPLPPAQDGARPAGQVEADPESGPAIEALRALGELHASGVLTDDEFAAKKAELLRRV